MTGSLRCWLADFRPVLSCSVGDVCACAAMQRCSDACVFKQLFDRCLCVTSSEGEKRSVSGQTCSDASVCTVLVR